MRIITGTARGKRLLAPLGNTTRPTSERVKEAIFSAIQFELTGRRVLDLFAGSGQMGLEALSRGATHATFVDSDAEVMALIKQNATATGFFDRSHFLAGDYRNVLRKFAGREPFDLVFIDPPYAMKAVPEALRGLLKSKLLAPGAIVVTESGEETVFADAEQAAAFTLRKATRYSVSYIHILQYNGDAALAEAEE